jgi:hypothetical protein
MDKSKLKIGVYVLTKYAKQTYSKECYNVRINAGMAVVCDILKRAGYTNIDYCSSSTAHKFDMVMYSVTADCDWWEFVAERVTWKKGDYKVVVGGQGVLNPRPFLELVDYFVLGRAENVQDKIADAILNGVDCNDEHVVCSKTYNPDRLYYINQSDEIYPHDILLDNGQTYHEDVIGCNHKCLFCGYTWHRKQAVQEEFNYSGLWNGGADRERAMIDMHNGVDVDLVKLRTTAIDGLSERLRFSVNKKITRSMLQEFLERLAKCEKPHQVKFYNIVGYPTETFDDWEEFLDDIRTVDAGFRKQEKQTSILLHSTPFRAMPATPLACKPMSYINYRGLIAKKLGKYKYKGNIFYQGNAMWGVESMATESLCTVTQSAIIWRGTESDTANIIKIATNKKFSAASSLVKQATLEKYFDVAKLFGAYTPDTLPTRNIRTYCKVEKMW